MAMLSITEWSSVDSDANNRDMYNTEPSLWV